MEKKMIEDKVSELLNEIGYRPDRDTYACGSSRISSKLMNETSNGIPLKASNTPE